MQRAHPVRDARRRLLAFGVALVVLNVVAAAVAVAANWPSQFGEARTDAGEDVITAGTAISAPLLPIAILVVSLLLVWRGGRALVAGVVGVCLTAAMFFIGAVGELTAEGTDETPKTVLVAAGIVWAIIALALFALASVAFAEWRRRRSTP